MLQDTMDGITKLAVAGVLIAAAVGPVIYHVVWCIEAAAETGSAIALLIAGLMFPPLGWVHGVSLLFGATWI